MDKVFILVSLSLKYLFVSIDRPYRNTLHCFYDIYRSTYRSYCFYFCDGNSKDFLFGKSDQRIPQQSIQNEIEFWNDFIEWIDVADSYF
jgi:hypothetical protein